jgi:hypothetical protein
MPGRLIPLPYRLNSESIRYLEEISAQILKPADRFVMVTRNDGREFNAWMRVWLLSQGFEGSQLDSSKQISVSLFVRHNRVAAKNTNEAIFLRMDCRDAEESLAGSPKPVREIIQVIHSNDRTPGYHTEPQNKQCGRSRGQRPVGCAATRVHESEQQYRAQGQGGTDPEGVVVYDAN